MKPSPASPGGMWIGGYYSGSGTRTELHLQVCRRHRGDPVDGRSWGAGPAGPVRWLLAAIVLFWRLACFCFDRGAGA